MKYVKQVKDYNYSKARRLLSETGQLKDDRLKDERKELENGLNELIEKEDGYDYEIDQNKAGVIHKKADYFNRTELERLADVYPEEKAYNYQIAKKQLKLKD
ncbi:hypothetical protein DSECCO2_359930 [anaerobic digester metagenome]